MQPGTIDLIIFGLIFISLQALWILPILRKSDESNKEILNLKQKRNQLEKLYKIEKP